MIDLLKSAPRWFLMLVVSGSVAFGCAAGTMCGMVIVDSLSRIERYSRDVWQVQLAELADRMGKQESRTDHHAEEFKRRAEDDAAFRAEMRREFDRLNFRLTQKGR